MDFTYSAYEKLLVKMKSLSYVSECFDYNQTEKSVIVRHDVDFSLERTIPIAKIENRLKISAIYFVLVSTNFYNVFSKESREILQNLLKMGHKIGLHFDASIYDYATQEELEKHMTCEKDILSKAIGKNVDVVSFHRPVESLFNVTLHNGMISAYDKKYFKGYTYLSDSRRHWRNDPDELLDSKEEPEHIQLLTHPIWYSDSAINQGADAICRLRCSINHIVENSLQNNIRDFESFMQGE